MTSMFENDPFGKVKTDRSNTNASTREVTNFHSKADTDGSPLAIHHTLGIDRNQAAPGNHVHDGKASPKIGRGLNLTVTGSRGGNAALASLLTALHQVIDFNDTTS